MGRCVFKTSELRRCAEHAIRSQEFRSGYVFSSDTPTIKSPGLLFVHDHGIYILSNGKPFDLIEGDSEKTYVAYAEHCNPTVNNDFWETSRDLVGGNDFVEFLPFGTHPAAFLDNCDNFEEYIVDVSDDYIECSFAQPKCARPALAGEDL